MIAVQVFCVEVELGLFLHLKVADPDMQEKIFQNICHLAAGRYAQRFDWGKKDCFRVAK